MQNRQCTYPTTEFVGAGKYVYKVDVDEKTRIGPGISQVMRRAFLGTYVQRLCRTSQEFNSLVSRTRKHSCVIEDGSRKHFFWAFVMSRKLATDCQVRSS
jgi:hypothetical protein